MSLPSRERGLKLDEFQSETGDYCVAPLAGAWIEIPEIKHHRNVIVSLPSRERGLKYCDKCEGCTWRGVAPLAGAWIEINVFSPDATSSKSLPSRERGLKFCTLVLCTVKAGRSPRGSVD